MRIGTVTYYDGRTNYGQALQCYALIKFLRSMGHDAFYIRYDNSIPRRRGLLREIVSNIYHWVINPSKEKVRKKMQRERNAMVAKDMEHPRGFDSFMRANIPSTEEIFTKNSTYSSFPKADAFFCGSDQIWAGADPIFYLQFAPMGSKRIAYAPSFGGYVPKGKKEAAIRKYIQSFDFISCREKSGVELCKILGREDAVIFPDPTLLLFSNDYKALYEKSKVEYEDYILLYLLGNEIAVDVERIFDFAKSINKQIVYVASQGRFDDFPKVYPSIGEWLYLIKNATCVITNSFHGTVFCLQFRKKFLTIPLAGCYLKQNDRIFDLLGKYHLKSRIYDGDMNRVMDDLDFTLFDKYQQKDVQIVRNVLSKQLL